jgi:hypothetical protein
MGLNHSPHPLQQKHYTTFSGTRIGNSKSWLKPQRSTAPRRTTVAAGAYYRYHRPPARRFPPPWIVEEHNDACFIVRDATGQAHQA